MKKQIAALVLGVVLSITAVTTLAQSTLSVNLTQIHGTWDYGNNDFDASQYGLGIVNDSTDIARVNSILTGPYIDETPLQYNAVASGIYFYAPGGSANLVFSIAGGAESALGLLSIVTSRNQYSGTLVGLDYSTDGGSTWQNALSATTAALNWQNWDSTTTLNFGGVVGNAFRLDFSAPTTSANEVSIHTVTLDTAVVPEPGTMALAGLGGAGLWLFRRRK